MPEPAGLWSIGELAERAGATVKTVRFYSDRGCCRRRPAAPGDTAGTVPRRWSGSA